MRIFTKFARGVLTAAFAVALLAAPAAGPAFAQVAAAALSAEIENAAKAPGDTPAQRDARTAVAKAFYDSTGMSSRFAGDLAGIDLGKPVQMIPVSAGTQMYQFIREGAKYLGNFFSPSAQAQPTCLGISGTGRTQVTATMPAATALLSTAAPIVDTWTTQGVSVQTEGGCAQVVVDNNTKTKATFTR